MRKYMKNFIIVVFLIFTASFLFGEIIIDEDFSGTFPPDGWTTYSSSGQINWQQGSGSTAGGTAPAGAVRGG